MMNMKQDVIDIISAVYDYDETASQQMDPNSRMDALLMCIAQVQKPLINRCKEILALYEGRDFPDEEKKTLVDNLNAFFRKAGIGVICPKTGIVGKLRTKNAGRDNRTVFEVRVWEKNRRTSHFSSTKFPRLELVSINSSDEEN